MRDSDCTEGAVRNVLRALGFEELVPGSFARLDGPHGQAKGPGDARFVTTVALDRLVGNAGAVMRLLRRFPRARGALLR
jgi:hypothetical protein